MRYSSMWRRRALATIVATALATAGMALAGATGPAGADPTVDGPAPTDVAADTLSGHGHTLLAQAEAKGEPNVTLIVATDQGKAPGVAGELTKLGAKVANRVDAVGYVRASVPTAAVTAAAKLPGIAAIDLNEPIKLPDPRSEARGTAAPGTAAGAAAPAGAQAAAVAAPGAGTPAANPYLPTNETGAVSFKQQHPTWDGRGVTVGILDSGVDLDSPALQKTSTGARKIVDWVTATDPVFDSDGTWRPMITSATGPAFTYAGAAWKAPAGSYRVSLFSESITAGGDPAGDVNRDGDTTDRFGILYDPVSHDIRVDSDQDHDFTNNPVMRPYREKFDIGHFGTDNPATAIREQIPFVVEYRQNVDVTPLGLPGTADFVNIGIIEASHATHVAGITAGNDLFGNPVFDGAAPGATIVSARACSWDGGCTAAALTDGMVDLVVNRHVDVVNLSIGGLPALNDANNARSQLYDRLIKDYGVQMFISAGNSGPGVNTVSDPSVATDAVSVAASVSKETWLANYGSVVRKDNGLFNFSSRGPREDGGFKPNITAPGSAISTTPLWQPGGPVPQAGYPLPPGYSMFNGTSMAAPEATGAAALLLSAAKATDRPLTPAVLRRAVYSSAKFLDGVPATGQGNGEFDVNGAWALLGRGVQARDYTADAPVCTPLSDFLAVKDRGVGIYNECAAAEGGHKPGQSKSYQVKITRTSGPDKGITHTVSWLGNDGTFNAPQHVVLQLNKTATISVQAKPSAGVHSAIMRLDDPATPNVDYEVLNTVIAADEFTKPAYGFDTAGTVDRNAFTSYFVNVPAGTPALQVNLSGVQAGSQTRFVAFSPWGVPVDSTASADCFTNYSDAAVCNPTSRSYANPIPGLWEIEVEARRTSATLANPFHLAARTQGVTLTPAVVELATVKAGQPAAATWTITNPLGPVKVTAQGGGLGSATTKRPSIAGGESQTYNVVVPTGATRLDVAIGNTSDRAADLDLFVTFNGAVVGQSADGDAEEAVSLINPAAGTYTVRVDGYAVPSGSTEYDYRDVFYSSALGAVSVSAPTGTIALANGDSATVTGSVTVKQAPEAGRTLSGELTVVTDEGAIIGHGTVRIGKVT